jgi:transposase
VVTGPPGAGKSTAARALARHPLAAEHVADLRHLEARLRETKAELTAAVKASSTSPTGIFGVGPIIAATVIGDTEDSPGSPAATSSPPRPARPHQPSQSQEASAIARRLLRQVAGRSVSAHRSVSQASGNA